MKQLTKEYTILFNGITDTLAELDRVRERLEALQQEAERLVVNSDEAEELLEVS